jgi:hypothetical protein
MKKIVAWIAALLLTAAFSSSQAYFLPTTCHSSLRWHDMLRSILVDIFADLANICQRTAAILLDAKIYQRRRKSHR